MICWTSASVRPSSLYGLKLQHGRSGLHDAGDLLEVVEPLAWAAVPEDDVGLLGALEIAETVGGAEEAECLAPGDS